MRAIIQRVKKASVTIDNKIKAKIEHGILVLIGICETDNEDSIKWMVNKLINLRIFSDENQKMNLSVQDVNGSILFISNFTLYADVNRGFRPSFSAAAVPQVAEPIYDKMLELLKSNTNIKIESGVFGAMMDIELINDGPVTIIIEN